MKSRLSRFPILSIGELECLPGDPYVAEVRKGGMERERGGRNKDGRREWQGSREREIETDDRRWGWKVMEGREEKNGGDCEERRKGKRSR